jgi:hypothetical protein
VRSSGDFDGLDAPESWFLNHRLVSLVTDKLANKKKINITKIKMYSHELNSEMGCFIDLKTSWYERIYHIWNTKKVEDKKGVLL